MTRMGQGMGLDLSPAIDALLLEGERKVSNPPPPDILRIVSVVANM